MVYANICLWLAHNVFTTTTSSIPFLIHYSCYVTSHPHYIVLFLLPEWLTFKEYLSRWLSRHQQCKLTLVFATLHHPLTILENKSLLVQMLAEHK